MKLYKVCSLILLVIIAASCKKNKDHISYTEGMNGDRTWNGFYHSTTYGGVAGSQDSAVYSGVVFPISAVNDCVITVRNNRYKLIRVNDSCRIFDIMPPAPGKCCGYAVYYYYKKNSITLTENESHPSISIRREYYTVK